MGWLCAESGFKHTPVPKDLVAAADAAGKAALEGSGGLRIAAAASEEVDVVSEEVVMLEETNAALEEKAMDYADE